MKGLLGLIAGLVAGALAMMAVSYVGTSLYPLHLPADPRQTEALMEGLRTATVGAQIVVLLCWFVGAFVGAAVARALSGKAWPGWTIAGLLAAILAFIFFMPLPIWMQTLAPVSPLLGAAAADLLIPRRRTGEADNVQA
jgi:MFS family permease